MALYDNGGLGAPRLFIGFLVKYFLDFLPCSPNENFYQWSSLSGLWRFVCYCLAALMSLSRNVDCCQDSSGQMAFVFYGEC